MNLIEAAALPVGALVAPKNDLSRRLLIIEKDEEGKVFTLEDNLKQIDYARFDEWPYWDKFVRL
jgi:hypothetical protein